MPLYERGVDCAFSLFLLLGVQVTGSLAVRVALRVICRLGLVWATRGYLGYFYQSKRLGPTRDLQRANLEAFRISDDQSLFLPCYFLQARPKSVRFAI